MTCATIFFVHQKTALTAGIGLALLGSSGLVFCCASFDILAWTQTYARIHLL